MVCEWMIASQSKSQVTISGIADDGKIGEFPLAGRVDRVDELHIPGNDNTQRFIIIRDMKAYFDELNMYLSLLHIYAFIFDFVKSMVSLIFIIINKLYYI